jgi:hypothetical protein
MMRFSMPRFSMPRFSMPRVLQVLLSGLFLGMGISTAFAEFWLASAACFIATGAGLFVIVRTSLQEATQWPSTTRSTQFQTLPGAANAKSKLRTALTEESLAHAWPASTNWKRNMPRAGLIRQSRKGSISRRQ